MRLGFDAKRALNNFTGLGNHARILLNAMMRDFPENDYLLFSPKAKHDLLNEIHGDYKLALPEGKMRGSLWRSWGITNDLISHRVNIYHGLSNELPFNIHRSGIKTVVTIHDVIFLKHTEQYPFTDRQIYALKTRYAVKHADKIIAVSQETKEDLMHFYKVPGDKIEVIYQSVDPAFQTNTGVDPSTTKAYNLPAKFILNVGSFYPRKNQKTLIKAFDLIKDKIEEDLVLVGSEGYLLKEIEELIKEKNLNSRVKILTGVTNQHLPAIYRLAGVFVYPSLFEGFGIPVLEALFSKVPVIASGGGAIEEAGGSSSLFIEPGSASQIADAIMRVLKDDELKKRMIESGLIYAQSMTDKVFAQKVMTLYKEISKTD